MRFHMRLVFQLVLAVGVSAAHAGSYEDFFGALMVDNASAVQQLLQRGFDPDSRDPKGETALFVALRDGALKSAEVLMAQPGVSLDAMNAHGETALMIAALKGRLDAAKRLVSRGARIDHDGWNPLLYAATGPETKIVALLLERGAKVDARSPNGSTPLMMAARYGAEGSVDLLLLSGADRSLRNDRGLTAADFARQGGREALAVRLQGGAR